MANTPSDQPAIGQRQIILGAAGLLLVMVIGGLFWTWRPAIPPISPPSGGNVDERVLRLRASLPRSVTAIAATWPTPARPMRAGHRSRPPSARSFKQYHARCGDQHRRWSEAAFRRAMRDGVNREGRELYPAFPYDHFTKATDDDIHALYVYLTAQPAVRNPIPPQ